MNYDTVPRDLKHKNGAAGYTQIKVGRNKHTDILNSDNKYTASDIRKIIEYLVDNKYVYVW